MSERKVTIKLEIAPPGQGAASALAPLAEELRKRQAQLDQLSKTAGGVQPQSAFTAAPTGTGTGTGAATSAAAAAAPAPAPADFVGPHLQEVVEIETVEERRLGNLKEMNEELNKQERHLDLIRQKMESPEYSKKKAELDAEAKKLQERAADIADPNRNLGAVVAVQTAEERRLANLKEMNEELERQEKHLEKIRQRMESPEHVRKKAALDVETEKAQKRASNEEGAARKKARYDALEGDSPLQKMGNVLGNFFGGKGDEPGKPGSGPGTGVGGKMGLGDAVGGIGDALGPITESLGELGAVLGPVGIAIGAVVGAIGLVVGVAETARQTFLKLGDAVAGFVGKANHVYVERYQLAQDDLVATIGHSLIPVMEKFTEVTRLAGDIIATITPSTESMEEVMSQLDPVLDDLREAFSELAPVLEVIVKVNLLSLAGILKLVAIAVHQVTENWRPLLEMLDSALGIKPHLDSGVGASGRNVSIGHDFSEIGRDIAKAAMSTGVQEKTVQQSTNGILKILESWEKSEYGIVRLAGLLGKQGIKSTGSVKDQSDETVRKLLEGR